jgi:hypothetical protein
MHAKIARGGKINRDEVLQTLSDAKHIYDGHSELLAEIQTLKNDIHKLKIENAFMLRLIENKEDK